jgi:lipopolysaccharide export system protein LptA
MKYLFPILLMTVSLSFSQDSTPTPPTPAPSTNSLTTITSDSLDLNLGKQNGKKQGLFRGNVTVDEPRFTMTAKEMTVFFADNDAVQSLEARDDVIIKRKDGSSETLSEKAVYEMADKKLILLKVTRQPKVTTSDKKIVEADTIIIYPEDNKLETKGKSSIKLKAP